MNLAKELRQISNDASIGWEERFEKYMVERCKEAAKLGDTFIIIYETERFEGKKNW